MKTVCEYMTKNVLPGFRALLAKSLMDKYKFNQTQVAKLLNTTQPAISQYKRDLRGKNVRILTENRNVMEMIENIAKRISEGEILPENAGLEFCNICKFLRENNLISL